MKIYTIDELAKGREVSLKDYPGYRGHGRGPDKQKRKSKGTISYSSGGKQITGFDYKQMKKQGAKGLSKISFEEAEENRKATSDKYYERAIEARKAGNKADFEKYTKLAWGKSLELTSQDRKNIDFIRELVSKRPDLQKALEGPVKWVGQEGFDTCVDRKSVV